MFLLAILVIVCPFGVDFRGFWVAKQVPGGYVFGVFLKTVIFSKSCSRCGGSTILKGQTLQKSVRKATPNGNGARIDKKLLKTSLCDALWAEKVDFRVILGSGRDHKMVKSGVPGLDRFWGPRLRRALGALF